MGLRKNNKKFTRGAGRGLKVDRRWVPKAPAREKKRK